MEINDDIKVVAKIAEKSPNLKADPTYVRRILSNLLLNAEQAMSKGGKITVTAHKENENIFITVEDTGEGIPEGIKHKIFQPLFTTRSKGQGFGLAVSKRLATAMDGDITFESTKGKGSKFTLKIPAS